MAMAPDQQDIFYILIVSGGTGAGEFIYDAAGNLRSSNVGQVTTDPVQGITCQQGFATYNGHGAVINLLSTSNGAFFQYQDLGTSTQGPLILVVASTSGTDPVDSTAYTAGMTGIDPAFGDSVVTVGANIGLNQVAYTRQSKIAAVTGSGASQPKIQIDAPEQTQASHLQMWLAGESPDASKPAQLLVGAVSGAGTLAPLTKTAVTEVQGGFSLGLAASSVEIWIAPSGDLTGAKDTAAINGALGSFKTIHLLPGTFTINAALTPGNNQSIIGAGTAATTINQVTNAAEGITVNNGGAINLRGFFLAGKGSGVSTAAGVHFASNPPSSRVTLDDVIVQGFGLQGFLFDSLFLVAFRNCEALQNGGQGFMATNSFAVPTSFSFQSCYANGNGGNGYEFDGLQYSSLNGCAADGNPTGYALFGCQGVTLTGCGTETFTATGYLFNNCKGCGLYSGFTFSGKTKVAWVTNGTSRQTIGGLTETSPAAGATACIQTDAGTSSVLWGITHVTADSLTAGTFTNVDGSA